MTDHSDFCNVIVRMVDESDQLGWRRRAGRVCLAEAPSPQLESTVDERHEPGGSTRKGDRAEAELACAEETSGVEGKTLSHMRKPPTNGGERLRIGHWRPIGPPAVLGGRSEPPAAWDGLPVDLLVGKVLQKIVRSRLDLVEVLEELGAATGHGITLRSDAAKAWAVSEVGRRALAPSARSHTSEASRKASRAARAAVARVARQHRILEELRLASGAAVSARVLSHNLGVGQRTVERDLAELRAAGVPIRAGRGPDGGHFMSTVPGQVSVTVTATEAAAIAVALVAVGPYASAANQTALAKLISSMPATAT